MGTKTRKITYFIRKGLLEILIALVRFPAVLFSGKAFNSSEHSVLIPEAFYSPWMIDDAFNEAYDIAKNNTLVEKYRCFNLWALLDQVKELEGDFIEIGVWRGGTGCLIAKKCQNINKNSTVYLCDTFKGIVKVGEIDKYFSEGDYADTNEDVINDLAKKLNINNIKIVPGVFPDETGKNFAKDVRFRFCHIDVDVYQSAKDALDFVWERMPVGGIVVMDDYGCITTPGIRQLADEEAKKTGRVFMYNINGHGVLVKTSD